MKKIIINADDFGRHPLINIAVKQGLEQGCLRSATLMPGGIAFEDAVDIAKSHKQLGLGIHFTLVNGNPILPPDEIPSLVNEAGKFHDSYGEFVKCYALGKINFEEVARELSAQMEKLNNTHISLTHCDSHQHIHSLLGITEIALRIASQAKIKKIRIPATGLFLGGSLKEDHIGAVIGRLGLRTMAEIARIKARRAGFIFSDFFAGNVAGRAVNAKDFQRIITNLKPGVTELMMHPGTDNDILQKDCLWEHDFQAELAAVATPMNSEIFSSNSILPINFNDI